MTSNPNGFAKLAQQPNLLASFAANARSFEALGRQPAFNALALNPAFAAALQSRAFESAFAARGSGNDR